MALHGVGNKLNDDGIRISGSLLKTDADVRETLAEYFLSAFKSEEYFNFFHESDLKYNEVYEFVAAIFDDPDCLFDESVSLAKHLYEKSIHPKIKAGELYVVYFDSCNLDGETVDAVGLFKSENKDRFLKVNPSGTGYSVEQDEGVNIHKLDKGCLIFNIEEENGFVVAVVDNTNKGTEAHYWIDEFLHLKQRRDAYSNTHNILSMCKDFVTKELPRHFEVTKADQIDLLNKSVGFFKKNDSFDLQEFTNEVIVQPGIIETFNHYKKDYEHERDLDIADQFDISDSAVKKQSRVFKSVIKLDKNFHIYIHGNRELIEQGSDERGKFYKVYYKEEL
jgi:hypothetical protein